MSSKYCEFCCFGYETVNTRQHTKFHKRLIAAKERDPRLMMPSDMIDDIKYQNNVKVGDFTLPLQERVEAAEIILTALWSRDYRHTAYDPYYVTLEEYFAMFLCANKNGAWFSESPDIIKSLIKKYGEKLGIATGSSAVDRKLVRKKKRKRKR